MQSNNNSALEALLEEIIGIADKEYQRRVWIRGEGPECDDFDETVCRYSNAIESILEWNKEYEISDIQLHLIKTFNEEFEKFSDDNNLPQLFIDTPEWTKITAMAKEVLEAFNYCKIDINKQKLLKNILHDLDNLSNKKYRKEIDILANGSEFDNFDATVCNYFKTIDSVLKEHKEYGIPGIKLYFLKKFNYAFKKFWHEHDFPKLFIGTPEWTNITSMAKDVLRTFNYQK